MRRSFAIPLGAATASLKIMALVRLSARIMRHFAALGLQPDSSCKPKTSQASECQTCWTWGIIATLFHTMSTETTTIPLPGRTNFEVDAILNLVNLVFRLTIWMQESCANATIGCPCDATWEHKCTADYGYGGAIQTTGWKVLLPKTHHFWL